MDSTDPIMSTSAPAKNGRRLLVKVVLLWAVTRLVLLGIGVSASFWMNYVQLNEEANLSHYQTSVRALDIWTRWDAQWYLYLADKGYDDTFLPDRYGTPFPIPFFPLFPLLIRFVGLFVRNLTVAGLLVSNIALILFLWALAQIYERKRKDGPDSSRVVFYYLIFPTSFFLSAVYSESVFLALCAWSLLMAMKGRWWIAGLIAGCATMSRPVGVALVPMLGIFYLQQIGFRLRDLKTLRNLDIRVLAPLLSIAGLVGFSVFCWIHYGDPISYTRSQIQWRQGDAGMIQAVIDFFRSGPALRGFYNSWIDFGIALFAVVTLPLIFHRYGLALGLFASIVVLMPLYTGFMSYQRLFLASFPHFMLLADVGKYRWVDAALVMLFAGGLSLFFAAFAQWGWIA